MVGMINSKAKYKICLILCIEGVIDKCQPKPIGQDEKECIDYRGNKFYVLCNKYDISKLKERIL
jgi:hypothetical protein